MKDHYSCLLPCDVIMEDTLSDDVLTSIVSSIILKV